MCVCQVALKFVGYFLKYLGRKGFLWPILASCDLTFDLLTPKLIVSWHPVTIGVKIGLFFFSKYRIDKFGNKQTDGRTNERMDKPRIMPPPGHSGRQRHYYILGARSWNFQHWGMKRSKVKVTLNQNRSQAYTTNFYQIWQTHIIVNAHMGCKRSRSHEAKDTLGGPA